MFYRNLIRELNLEFCLTVESKVEPGLSESLQIFKNIRKCYVNNIYVRI